jgi:TctA family transporter
MVVILGAFQTTRHWGDLFVLIGLGTLGWFMKIYGWPRPTMLVGYVLGKIVERYVHLSVLRYDMWWVLRPGVIVLGLLTLVVLYTSLKVKKPEFVEE